jgi:hypothetical protein
MYVYVNLHIKCPLFRPTLTVISRCRQVSTDFPNRKLKKKSSGVKKDGHDEAKSHISQLVCEKA